jgi:hypothetical protein
LSISCFQLPPALAEGIGNQCGIGFSQKSLFFLAKAIKNQLNFIPLKLEAINLLK